MTDENITFDFDAWLSGATVTEVSVDIFQRADILGKYGEWRRRYDRALQILESTERSMGEVDQLAQLEEEGEQLLKELEDSKTVWFLRALSTDDEEAVNEAHPLPEDPYKPFPEPQPEAIKSPTDRQAQAFIAAFEGWRVRRDEYIEKYRGSEAREKYAYEVARVLEARGAEKIARAFVRIEKDGVKLTDSLSIEQIEKLPAAIGEVQFGKIIGAIKAATDEEPEVPTDFLHRTSKNDLV